MNDSLAGAAEPEAKLRGRLLRDLHLLDSFADAEFDDLVSLAATLCGKPMGAMTLLDETTQLTKARTGLNGARTIPVEDSICQYTIRESGMMMVEDLHADARFHQNKAAHADGIRFYAGMPLRSDTGLPLGALCVMDSTPATLSTAQKHALETIGRQLSRLIQLREQARVVKQVAAERERTRKMLDIILNHVPVGMYLKDSEGRLRFYNQSIADRFHIDRDEWIGKTSYDLWDQPTAEELEREDTAVLQSGVAHDSYITVPAPDGKPSHWRSHKVPCLNGDGDVMLVCCSIDLTEQMQREAELQRTRDELQEANRKLSSLALTDALTGLWNRRAFDARLETSIIAAQRSKQPMTLMLIDVDHFKAINDRHGHPYGDTVLKQIAAILNRVKRAEDAACRFGGEEFAVLLPGTDVQAASHLSSRMLTAMRNFAWERGPVTVSIGLAMCVDHCLSVDLVDNADSALYQAKRSGRDRSVLYHQSPQTVTR